MLVPDSRRGGWALAAPIGVEPKRPRNQPNSSRPAINATPPLTNHASQFTDWSGAGSAGRMTAVGTFGCDEVVAGPSSSVSGITMLSSEMESIGARMTSPGSSVSAAVSCTGAASAAAASDAVSRIETGSRTGAAISVSDSGS